MSAGQVGSGFKLMGAQFEYRVPKLSRVCLSYVLRPSTGGLNKLKIKLKTSKYKQTSGAGKTAANLTGAILETADHLLT